MSVSREVTNARISSTTLGPKASDGRCFSSWIILEFEGGGQGFGGYSMDSWSEAGQRRVGVAWGMEFIARLLETVGVESWEELTGKHIRVDRDCGKVYRIGHIVKNKWFDPENDLKTLVPQKEAQ
jgi:hypothetical protein